MRIVIGGGSGFVGRSLAVSLLDAGHEVVILSRNPKHSSLKESPKLRVEEWDLKSTEGWGLLVSGADAVVNLAGANLGAARWSPERKKEILLSRVEAGRILLQAVAQAEIKPRALIQASGVDYYGVNAGDPIDESWPAGQGFLSDLCVQWESAIAGVEDLGIRKVIYRGAFVLGPSPSAFDRLLLPFRFFAGGPLGTGLQWFSWIHQEDQVRALVWFINHPEAQGVYNLSAPQPVQNRELASVIGRVMKRPAFLRVPGFFIRLLLGEMSVMVLGGQRVLPARLQREGFTFKFPTIEEAIRDLIRS